MPNYLITLVTCNQSGGEYGLYKCIDSVEGVPLEQISREDWVLPHLLATHLSQSALREKRGISNG